MFLLNKLQMTMFWIFTWCKIYLYVSVLIISKRTKFLKPLFHSRGNCWTTERGRQWWRGWWWLNIASYIGTHKNEFGYLPRQEEEQSDDMEQWDIKFSSVILSLYGVHCTLPYCTPSFVHHDHWVHCPRSSADKCTLSDTSSLIPCLAWSCQYLNLKTITIT